MIREQDCELPEHCMDYLRYWLNFLKVIIPYIGYRRTTSSLKPIDFKGNRSTGMLTHKLNVQVPQVHTATLTLT